MNLNDVLGCLEAKWRNYLEEHGHHLCQAESSLNVVRSHNGKKARFRWLLLVGHCPVRSLSRFEQAEIRHHLKQAKKEREHTYLVVGFPEELRRIVVLPADAALKAGRVRSDKGGIDWDG